MKLRYFDNAATSWPKPPAVAAAVHRCLVRGGGNAGHCVAGGSQTVRAKGHQVFYSAKS